MLLTVSEYKDTIKVNIVVQYKTPLNLMQPQNNWISCWKVQIQSQAVSTFQSSNITHTKLIQNTTIISVKMGALEQRCTRNFLVSVIFMLLVANTGVQVIVLIFN